MSTHTQWSHKLSIGPLVGLTGCLWILYRVTVLIWARLKWHKVFERGGIPSLGWGHFLYGNADHLFGRNNFCKLLLAYHRKLGKLVGLHYGPDPWVYTTDLDLINRVYVTERHKHVNQSDFRIQSVDHLAGSLFQFKGERWRRARNSVAPTFTKHQVTSRLDSDDRQVSCLKGLGWILGEPVDADGARTINVLHHFNAITSSAGFKKILDRHDLMELEPGKENELVRMTHRSFRYLISPVMKVYAIMPLAVLKWMVRFTTFGRYCRFLGQLIGESLALKYDNNRPVDGPEQISSLSANQVNRAKAINVVARMRDINPTFFLSFILFASFETSTSALTILFWYLARNAHIQDKLRRALQSEGQEADYLEWCIKEVLRLYPPAPTFGRILSEDVKLPGTDQTLFKGMTLAVCPYTIHRSEEYWGSDAAEFRPDRFSQPLGHRLQFIPFGAGARMCLGQHHAMQLMKDITALLVGRFRIEPSDSTPNELRWSPRNFMTLVIRGPIELKFIEIAKARSATSQAETT